MKAGESLKKPSQSAMRAGSVRESIPKMNTPTMQNLKAAMMGRKRGKK